MKETDLAYCAGIVDGEGYIGIKRAKPYRCQGRVTPSYHARIQIRMVDEPAIKFVAETLGGWYYKEKPNTAKGRPLYCYQASDKKAADILRILLPYLKVKREVAETVLKLRELQTTRNRYRTKVTGTREMPHFRGKRVVTVPSLSLSDEYVALCDSLYTRCREINRVGIAA